MAEYRRRIGEATSAEGIEAERARIGSALKRLRDQEDRLTRAYVDGALDLDRFKAEMARLRERKVEAERTLAGLTARREREQAARDAVTGLQRFCTRMSDALDRLTFEERQQLLRLVVERVVVDSGVVRVETIIPTDDVDDNGQLRTRRPELVEVRANVSAPPSTVLRACFEPQGERAQAGPG